MTVKSKHWRKLVFIDNLIFGLLISDKKSQYKWFHWQNLAKELNISYRISNTYFPESFLSFVHVLGIFWISCFFKESSCSSSLFYGYFVAVSQLYLVHTIFKKTFFTSWHHFRDHINRNREHNGAVILRRNATQCLKITKL